jgi:hypothetical protein
MRGGDEGAVSAGAREHDVARLVADEQRAHDARGCRGNVDDAHAVGQMVHDPHLGVRARRDRHGLEPDRHAADVRQPARGDVEDLEAIVGRVDGIETIAVGRERERSHLPALEGRERLRAAAGDRERAQESPPDEGPHAAGVPQAAPDRQGGTCHSRRNAC